MGRRRPQPRKTTDVRVHKLAPEPLVGGGDEAAHALGPECGGPIPEKNTRSEAL